MEDSDSRGGFDFGSVLAGSLAPGYGRQASRLFERGGVEKGSAVAFQAACGVLPDRLAPGLHHFPQFPGHTLRLQEVLEQQTPVFHQV